MSEQEEFDSLDKQANELINSLMTPNLYEVQMVAERFLRLIQEPHLGFTPWRKLLIVTATELRDMLNEYCDSRNGNGK